ncbi:MAG: hypothetical protein HLX45_10000 [Bacillus sp. (in: Bacteria)]|nr:hypothetical protein [Bacillus sp. (in: firmicutes)]
MKLRKRFIIQICAVIGLLIGAQIYINHNAEASSDNQKQKITNFSKKEVNNDKSTIKKLGKNTKLPTKVFFNKSSLDKNKNKSSDFHSMSFSKISEDLVEYRHVYSNEDHTQNILLSIVDSKNKSIQLGNIDSSKIKENVKLNNGVSATYLDQGNIQILTFTEPETKLFYSLIGQKDEGIFSLDELLDVANSLK